MKDGLRHIRKRRGTPVRKLLCLLMILLLCWPLLARAEEAAIDVQIAPRDVRYAFDFPQYAFVYVEYDTQNDSGSQVLYSENGHFEGSCYLPGTTQGERLGINVYALNHAVLIQTRVNTAADPTIEGPAAGLPEAQVTNRLQNAWFSLESGSLKYRFQAPGRDTLVLRWRSPQETPRVTLYAGADYIYQGAVELPCTYPDDAVSVSVMTANSTALYETSLLMPYQAPALPTTAVSDVLRGVTVCIDPGHQRSTQIETVLAGPNFNTMKTTQVGMAKGVETKRMESQLTLEIGMQLRNALMQYGAGVVVTRTVQDTFVGMLERADIPNNLQADFVLRLHCNSRSGNERVQGIEVYCPLSSSYARAVADTDGYRALGETLLTAIQDATGMHKGQCTLNDTYVGNNWSMMPSFLVEMGYMTNFEEDLLLSSPVYQQRLVDGMVQGIIDMARMRGLIK